MYTFISLSGPAYFLVVPIRRRPTAPSHAKMVNKAKKVGKNRRDKFYHLAKEQGFRSRASFKLVQLNKRHDFLSSAAHGVIDLCAAPGGWMQVARKHLPVNAPCVGIDLVPIKPVSGCIALQGDITSDQTKAQLKQALRQAAGFQTVDVVLNDGSPNMGKAWLQDAYTQSELTLAALKLASEFLAPGGTFVTKVFRSNDYNSLLFVMNQLFERVNATKPSASRTESAEIYVLCSHFKAPKQIDPRLLNPKHVFKDLTQPSQDENKPDLVLNTVMKNLKAAKRNRAGYQDGNLTMFRRISVLQFCRSPRPVAMLVENSQISCDIRDIQPDSSQQDAPAIRELICDMPETTDDVMHCLEDVKVLARRDFKLVLKWRAAARRKLREAGLLENSSHMSGAEIPFDVNTKLDSDRAGVSDHNGHKVDNHGDTCDTEEQLLDEEIGRARAEQTAKERRKRRKLNKSRASAQRKVDMKILLPEEHLDTDVADSRGLFSFNTASAVLNEASHVDSIPDLGAKDGYEAATEDEMDTSLPYRLAQAQECTDDTIEEDLNRWYRVYLSRRKRDKNGALLETKEKKLPSKRRTTRDVPVKPEQPRNVDKLNVYSSESSDEDLVETEGTALTKRSVSRETALWFAQPIFSGFEDSSDGGSCSEAYNGDSEQSSVEDEIDALDSFHKAAMKEAKSVVDSGKKSRGEVDFDIIPLDASIDETEGSASETLSLHSSEYDTDEKAEMIAIAKKMRQSKQVANDVLDEAYHRYTFDDPQNLPRWFADPDPTYRRRHPPVTKEQVSEMKEYIKSLQAAPTKKEAEAKARKRARVAKKMEAVKIKATNIAEQGDVPANSRMKAIEDLYRQALKSGKSGKKTKRKVYQVMRPNGRVTVDKGNRRGRNASRGAKTTLVDRRLKADKRGIAKAQKRERRKMK